MGSWAGAAAALDLIGSLDRAGLQGHCLRLAQQVRDGADERGIPCAPSELPSHIVTLRVPDADAAVRGLRGNGVRATARAGAVRLGFHGFNTVDDVSCALAAIEPLF